MEFRSQVDTYIQTIVQLKSVSSNRNVYNKLRAYIILYTWYEIVARELCVQHEYSVYTTTDKFRCDVKHYVQGTTRVSM